jgi:DNA-binding LacI/PurR family transcriptional regulator
MLIVDDLREMLFEHDFKLMVHEHPQVASRRPFEFLGKLITQQNHACWLLVGCGPDTIRWFGEHRVPAVVSGTCDPAVGLPFISLDNYALGRHAALTLLQYGHRRIGALLTHSNPRLRTGLNDVLASGTSDASLAAFEVEDAAESVAKAVDRLMATTPRPTAIFAAESNIYLSAFARLAQLHMRIPEDISLVCRDDEPYLRALLPEPARYSKNPHQYAKRLLALILKTTAAEPTSHVGAYIMPEFVLGPSLRRVTRNDPTATRLRNRAVV